ncbi:Hypothetical predicted protein [Pelobates cultripes]|uniref:PP1-binding domain-containing protein n=1 Tax=Pelobates cultripes TaxID=61616 RepID=A0AAD1RNE7_PELCU|nr:Hypothetical predicted protein [Pelobates cultripes]
MFSRKVLQEISISSLESQHELGPNLTDEKANMSLSHSSQRNVCMARDDFKENLIPADYGNISKEKSMCKLIGREPEENARDVSDQVAGLNDPAISNLQEKWNFSPTSMQHTDDKALHTSTRDVNFTTPKRGGEECDIPEEASHTPVDFANVTVDDFGISPECFTNKCAGKSPKSLLKYRRRSTIGVRGSPEMNFLIRQIAKQRSKMSREPVSLPNLFTSPRNSVLKSKMSAFRNAFQAVEENEGNVPFPEFSDERDTCHKNESEQQESIEPPEKRKKSFHDAGLLISRDPPAQTEKYAEECVTITSYEEIPESDYSVVSKLSPNYSEASELQCDSLPVLDKGPSKRASPKLSKKKVMFTDLLSPESQQLPKSLLEKDPVLTNACSNPILRPVLKRTPRKPFISTEEYPLHEFEEEKHICSIEENSPENGENVRLGLQGLEHAKDSVRKKRVTFGRELSPELFDQSLPANTPLRRGSTPYSRHTDSVTPDKDSTVFQSPLEPLSQPDFDHTEVTLEPLSLCFEDEISSCNTTFSASLPDEVLLIEQAENVPKESKPIMPCLQDEPLHSPSSKESYADISMSLDLENAETLADFTVSTNEPISSEKGRVTRSALKRKSSSSEDSSSNGSPVADHGKVPEKLEPKRVSKTVNCRKPVVAKKAQIRATKGKGKKSRGKPKKSVRTPLIEDRETVSKKPLLSPIPELPECWPTPSASTKLDFSSATEVKHQILKKVRKINGTQRSLGKVQNMRDCSDVKETDNKSVVWKMQEEEITLPSVSLVGTGESIEVNLCSPGLKSFTFSQIDSPAKPPAPTQATTYVHPTYQIGCQISEGSRSPVEPVIEQSVGFTLLVDNTSTISTEVISSKTGNVKSRRRSNRHSITYHNGPKLASQEEVTTVMGMLSSQVPVVHISQCLKEITGDSHSKVNRHPLSPEKQMATVLLCNLVEDPLSSKYPEDICRTPICIASDENTTNKISMENHSVVSPSSAVIAASMEDPMQSNAKHEKKVRRSMRLRRDSDSSGLNWVQEEKGTKEKRRSMNYSVKRQVDSPKWMSENEINGPVKDQQKNEPALDASRKSKRRTVCISTLWDPPSFN